MENHPLDTCGNSSVVCAVKYIIFDESVMESTPYNPPYPGNAHICACTVEGIVINMDIFPLILGSRRSIIIENPDSRPISIVERIIVNINIIHNACTLFDLNSRTACTPTVESVDYVIVQFYFIRVPYSKSAVGPAGYAVVPGFYVLTLNCKQAVVPELIYFIIVKLNIFTVSYPQPVSLAHRAYTYCILLRCYSE